MKAAIPGKNHTLCTQPTDKVVPVLIVIACYPHTEMDYRTIMSSFLLTKPEIIITFLVLIC